MNQKANSNLVQDYKTPIDFYRTVNKKLSTTIFADTIDKNREIFSRFEFYAKGNIHRLDLQQEDKTTRESVQRVLRAYLVPGNIKYTVHELKRDKERHSHQIYLFYFSLANQETDDMTRAKLGEHVSKEFRDALEAGLAYGSSAKALKAWIKDSTNTHSLTRGTHTSLYELDDTQTLGITYCGKEHLIAEATVANRHHLIALDSKAMFDQNDQIRLIDEFRLAQTHRAVKGKPEDLVKLIKSMRP